MISSARASTAGGIVSPRVFAVLRLITSSNLVGCSTGKSAGLAPFRITSAKFLHPTRPGSRLEIEYARTVTGELGFTSRVHGKPVLTGRLKCRGDETADRGAGPTP